jgi:hypothetical protein
VQTSFDFLIAETGHLPHASPVQQLRKERPRFRRVVKEIRAAWKRADQ